MRPSDTSSHRSKLKRGAAAALLIATTLAAGNARAQDAGSVDARLRALEARVAALEGRSTASGAMSGAPGAGAPEMPAIRCTALSVNGSAFPPGVTLTVAVNGATVGVHESYAGGDLEPFMWPGPNTVALIFSAPGTPGVMGTQAELRCLPPGSRSSRDEILRLRPAPGRLSAQAQVDLVRE